MDSLIQNKLEEYNAKDRYQKLVKKYQNKKVVLYGTGKFFEIYKNMFDLSKFNIAAVTDKKFSDIQAPAFDKSLGYNVISPFYLYKIKPDIVLISALDTFVMEKYICEELFKKTEKFKYEMLVEIPYHIKRREDWLEFSKIKS